MFVMLLGLINAEKAQKLLMEDIDDQKEMEDYYYYPAVNNKGETLDIVRLNSATKLASSTIFKLTIGTTIATIYLLVCLCLFAGVIKNRSNFIIPWMIFDVIISLVINSVLVIIGTNMLFERFAISGWMYCKWTVMGSEWLSLPKLIFRVFLYRVYGRGLVYMDCCVSILQYYQTNVKVAWGSSYTMSSADCSALSV